MSTDTISTKEPPGSNKLLEAPKIGVVYSDVKREYFPTEQQYITEKNALDDAVIISEEIKKLGCKVFLYPGNETLTASILRDKPEMIFNLVDSVKGNEYLSSTIPGMLDMMDIPYTGAGLLGLALCYNKFLTKKLLQNSGVPVPNFQLFGAPHEPLDINLRFPLISKLNEIHGAVEISNNSISENEKELRDRLDFLIKTYKQPVLVEEYIAGKEIVVYMLQGFNIKTYMAEKKFNKPDQKYQIATFEDQWTEGDKKPEDQAYTYQKYEDANLKEFARKAFEITRMEDYGKFDVRQDASGRFYFIDVNLNPAFGPKKLDTAIGLIIEDLYGIPFTDILKRLIARKLTDEGTNVHTPASTSN
jgi:D-alanine-D-alanine ligase